MIEVKRNMSVRLPVRLFDTATKLPKVNIGFSQITCSIEKADGGVSALTITTEMWDEVTEGAFVNQGKYSLTVPAGVTDQSGPLTYAVAVAGCDAYVGVVKVVQNDELLPYVSFISGGETDKPVIQSVVALSRMRVLVTFSEPVKMTVDPDGALTPGNYLIAGLEVTAASRTSDTSVELTTGFQVPNQPYELTIQNIVDLSGNAI